MENMPRGLSPFGTADDIAVQRGIAEFQAGRPVVIADAEEMIVALPVDGLTEKTWSAFKILCSAVAPRLVITKRRARVIGLEVPGPVFIAVAEGDTRDTICALAVGLDCERRSVAGMAGAAATRAIDLAKLAQRFPRHYPRHAGIRQRSADSATGWRCCTILRVPRCGGVEPGRYHSRRA